VKHLWAVLVLVVVACTVLACVGPVLIGLAHAAVPVVVAVGAVAVVLRIVWHYTGRD
jgi:hypothetical protein